MNYQDLFNCPCCGKPYLSLMKYDQYQNCIDFNEDIINTNFNDDTCVSVFDPKLKSLTRETTNINNNINKSFSITNFSFIIEKKNTNNNVINENSDGEKNESLNKFKVKNPKRLGRKTKRNNEPNPEDKTKKKISVVHDKFHDDNMRKKCKSIILKSLFEFINNKLKVVYRKDMGYGDFKKELKILEQKNNKNSTYDSDREFLGKKLIDIFSQKISSRCCNFSPEHNKKIIESLINEADEQKRDYFSKLFNLTFLDCLKYFAGDKYFSELEGMKDYSSIKEELLKDNEEDYANYLIYYLKHFEEFVCKKIKKVDKK